MENKIIKILNKINENNLSDEELNSLYEELYNELFQTKTIDKESLLKIKSIINTEDSTDNQYKALIKLISNDDNNNNIYEKELFKQATISILLGDETTDYSEVLEEISNPNIIYENNELLVNRCMQDIKEEKLTLEEVKNSIEDYETADYLTRTFSDVLEEVKEYNQEDQEKLFNELKLLNMISENVTDIEQKKQTRRLKKIKKNLESSYIAHLNYIKQDIIPQFKGKEETITNKLKEVKSRWIDQETNEECEEEMALPLSKYIKLIETNDNKGKIPKKYKEAFKLYEKLKTSIPSTKKEDLEELKKKIIEEINKRIKENNQKLSIETDEFIKKDLTMKGIELSSDLDKLKNTNITNEEILKVADKYNLNNKKEDKNTTTYNKINNRIKELKGKESLTSEETKELENLKGIIIIYDQIKNNIKELISKDDDFEKLTEEEIKQKIDNYISSEEISKMLEKFNNFKDDLTKELKQEIYAELIKQQKKKESKPKKLEKSEWTRKKSILAFGVGALIGVGTSLIPVPAGIIARTAVALAPKVINTIVTKVITNDNISDKTKAKVGKIRSALANPNVQKALKWGTLGFAVGYGIGSIHHHFATTSKIQPQEPVLHEPSGTDEFMNKFQQGTPTTTTVSQATNTDITHQVASQFKDLEVGGRIKDGKYIHNGATDSWNALSGNNVHLMDNSIYKVHDIFNPETGIHYDSVKQAQKAGEKLHDLAISTYGKDGELGAWIDYDNYKSTLIRRLSKK